MKEEALTTVLLFQSSLHSLVMFWLYLAVLRDYF